MSITQRIHNPKSPRDEHPLINPHEAKLTTLAIWEAIVEHEYLSKKCLQGSRPVLFEKMTRYLNKCPLCEVFLKANATNEAIKWEDKCPGCPLKETGNQCGGVDTPFDTWNSSRSPIKRILGAQRIVDIVTAWEPEVYDIRKAWDEDECPKCGANIDWNYEHTGSTEATLRGYCEGCDETFTAICDLTLRSIENKGGLGWRMNSN